MGLSARVKFQGRLKLRKDTDGRETTYSAVIQLNPGVDVRVDGPVKSPPHGPSKPYEIEVPLRRERYEELMRALESSKAESPGLVFDGGIEVSVKGDCLG